MKSAHFVLSEYLSRAMEQAAYDKLEDGSYSGRIPACRGVLAFADSLAACEQELRSTLEDWLLLGLKLRHELPVIDGINLNEEPQLEPVDSV